MWKGFLCFLATAAATTFDCDVPLVPGQDRRRDPSTWTVAQYNVEWLFTEPNSICPGQGDCPWNTTQDEYIHLDTIAKVIQSIDADTWHLCEVQSCDQLRLLNEALPGSDYQPYMIRGEDSYTGQNVGLLTRVDPMAPLHRTEARADYPLPGSKCGYNGTAGTEGVTKHLLAEFQVGEERVYMVGGHLLSNPTDPTACAKREAQATVLQEYVETITASQPSNLLVLGDMNDFDGKIPDINRNQPTSTVLDILKSAGLESVAKQTRPEDRYSDWYDPNEDCVVQTEELSTIDHVLVSDALWKKVDQVEYKHVYAQGCGIYESDHYPLVVKFVM